jgi:hypothetical protein
MVTAEDPTEFEESGEEFEGTPEEESMGAIPPEAVCYRPGASKCSACEYFMAGNMCSRLGVEVEPQASCNLFEDKTEDAQEESTEPEPAF